VGKKIASSQSITLALESDQSDHLTQPHWLIQPMNLQLALFIASLALLLMRHTLQRFNKLATTMKYDHTLQMDE
jgi:hypothetical protein